tara:strand:- start:469 stop:681 length:213 start_codon:yes stop_codon:yes gene_type:complete
MPGERREEYSELLPVMLEIKGDVKAIKKSVGDHETRVRSLEKTSHIRTGAFGVMTVLLTGAVGWLWKHMP